MNIWQLFSRLITSNGEAAVAQEEPSKDEVLQAIAAKGSEEKAFAEAVEKRDFSSALQHAMNLLENQRYETAIQALEYLIHEDRNKTALCEYLIGKAYHQLHQYQKSLQYFIAAKVHEIDPQLIDKAIFDCCMELAKNADSKAEKRRYLNKYLILCPQGKYREQIQEQLNLLTSNPN